MLMKNVLRKLLLMLCFFTYVIESHALVNRTEKTDISFEINQQTIQVKGVVMSEFDEPLPGATITIKGTTKGVITDIDGNFTIDAASDATLVVSYIGMEKQEIKVSNRKTIHIILKELRDELEEVTVVAFAKQKKESVISSITTVKPSELKAPSSNLTTALAGRMAGMIAYQTSGEPGKDNAQFFIRGVTTFGYKKDPLILIDNIELSADDLARLNVDDIASFSIMKDATSTALYGARGANGVIMVTTKEGKEGPAKVSIRLENSISTPTKMVELADPITYMRLGNEAVTTRNPLGITPYSQEKIDKTIAGTNPYAYPAIDWYDELFKSQVMNQRVNFNISGGGKVAKYYIAASYTKDNGVIKMDNQNNFNSGIDLQKFNVRSNININLTPTTEASIRFQGSFDDYRGPVDGGDALFKKVMRTNPVLFPKYYPKTGEYANSTHILFGNYEDGTYLNPFADMVRGYKESNRSLILAQGEVKQKLDIITKGLSARGLISTTRYSYNDVVRQYKPFYYQVGSYNNQTNEYSLHPLNETSGEENLSYEPGGKDVQTTNYMELSMTYNRDFDEHGISGMLVYTRQEKRVSNADDLQKSLPYRNQGLSGRFTYSYAKKYFGEFNFGYNGSERFSKNERFGFFPSIGAGYIISNEKFFEPLTKYISKLKFKYTYGLVGNDAIGNENDRFFYLSNVNTNDDGKQQQFGNNYDFRPNGITVTRYANNLITWETAKKMNFGIELGLFNSLEIQLDLFKENRKDILMERSYIPSTMGLSAPVKANVGEASSKGIDLSVDYSFISQSDFWMTGRANFTYAISKFEKVEEPDYNLQKTPWRSRVGQSLNQRWGYIAERLFIDEGDIINSPDQSGLGFYEAGDIKYKDINKDGKITEADMVPIGYPTTPEVTFGFGLSTGYKNFDFSVFFQGNSRVSFWIDPNAISPFIDTDGNDAVRSENAMLKVIADNHWSEGNRNSYAFWPRLANRAMDNNYKSSTWWMNDGSFLRLKSIELGYSLPTRLLKKIRIEGVRIYVSGTNLLTFSKFKLWDPEMGSNGLGYPIQRVYNMGLTLNF